MHDSTGSVSVVEQAILQHLMADDGGQKFTRLNLSAIAREIGVHQSTASRVAHLLRREGRIEMRRPGWYRLGRKDDCNSSSNDHGDILADIRSILHSILEQQKTNTTQLERIEGLIQSVILRIPADNNPASHDRPNPSPHSTGDEHPNKTPFWHQPATPPEPEEAAPSAKETGQELSIQAHVPPVTTSPSPVQPTLNLQEETQETTVAVATSSSDVPAPKSRGRKKRPRSENPAERFAEWWALYPVKQDKKKALERWKLINGDAIADRLIEDIKQRIHTKKWKSGFIPHPSTYLNNERWEDELIFDDENTSSPKTGFQSQSIQTKTRFVKIYDEADRNALDIAIKQFGAGLIDDVAQELIASGIQPTMYRVLSTIRNHMHDPESPYYSFSDIDDSFMESIDEELNGYHQFNANTPKREERRRGPSTRDIQTEWSRID